MTPILEVTGVSKSYGKLEVLKAVSFAVADGETFAVIGPNGAGKTTLFKVMTGEEACRRGTVRYRGQDVTGLRAYQRVRQGFGRTFQVARVFLDMSVLENVVVAVESRRRTAGEFIGAWWRLRPTADVIEESSQLLKGLGLHMHRGHEARFLSHGDKKRLEFAVALGLSPQILMLDEPTAGMSPADRHATVDLIRRLRVERGVTVVMTEHDMDVILGLADRILVMNYGEIIAIGDPNEIRRNKTVRDVYLGQEMYSA